MTAAATERSGDGGFVHLHVHTEYSMLDGAARLKDMFDRCVQAGMPAVAMTDHGNLYGAYDFWAKATKAGVKPIIGIEAYVAPEHRRHRQPVRWGTPAQKDDDVSGAGAYTHMTLLAETTEGLHNLFRLSSLASLEGYFRKPRMDRELLAAHARGIIATTGCPSGEVQTRLRLGQYPQALEAAAAYRDIFGPGSFFVEIMDHGLAIEQRVRDGLRRIAAELSLPFVVTNDSHYTVESDAQAHEVLLCVQTGSNMADPGRFRFDGTGYYLKTPQEMRAAFTDEEWQSGCDSTLLIAERADVAFQPKNLMPLFDVPAGETEEGWLRQEVWRGMDRRYPGGYDEQRRQQAEYELGVITQMGFCSYFLVVADFIMWAKNNGIRVGPGRGSAAGSIVAYALGITDLDPISHGLIFERFLNPERVSMPDIDIDFDERRRGDVIRYVTEKWGEDKVAQIITYGTIKAKAAVKDSARVLGFPYALGDRITKAFPPAGDGQGHPAVRDLRREPSPVRRGRRDPRPVRGGSRGQAGHRHGPRAGGADPPGRRARGRRDHEQRADRGPRAGLEARGRRRGHHPVRLPGLRVAGPAQDGLPRPAQPHRAGRRGARHQGQPGHRHRPGEHPARRQAHLRAAGPRRHARHLPVRRRPDARAAAQHAARQLRGHLRGRRAVPAGPDGRQRAQRVRRPEEQPQAGGPAAPRAGRRRWPTSWATPTG